MLFPRKVYRADELLPSIRIIFEYWYAEKANDTKPPLYLRTGKNCIMSHQALYEFHRMYFFHLPYITI